MRKSLLVVGAVIALGGCANDFKSAQIQKPTQIQRMRFEPARMAGLLGDHPSALAIYEDANRASWPAPRSGTVKAASVP